MVRKGVIVRNGLPVYHGKYFDSDMDNIFEGFKRDMERLFGDPWSLEERAPRLRPYHTASMMPVDFKDEGKNYMVSADMPGVDRENVQLSIDDDVLTVKIDCGEEKEEEKENYLMKERYRMSCQRSLRLPGEVLADKVDAKMENGVLNITLPKKEPTEKPGPKTIEVK